MATITSNAVTGNWSATGSWSGGVVPGAGDLAIIANGAIITVDVNTTIGATTSVGIGVTINGASSSSFGTLKVAAGVSLTLRGFDATTHAMMQINQYGLFSPQPGSTVLGDVAADFGSCIINKGRFEAIGTTGSHITFSVPQDATHVNWGSVSDTNSKALSEAKTPSGYDSVLNLAIVALGNPLISNALKTGIGSMGDSSLTVNSSTPSLTTEVALGAYPTPGSNVTSAGKYAIDYETGLVYLYTTSFGGMAFNSTYWKLDKVAADWRGWGIVSWGATTGNTCLIDYCDFQYMGASTSGGKTVNAIASSAPVVLQGHIGGDTTRLAYVKHSTFKYGYKYVQLANCTGISTDPILISSNTFGDCSGGTNIDGLNCFTSTATYITIDSNTLNTRGSFIDVTNIGSDIPNWTVTNNTGLVGQCFWNATAIAGPITPFARRSSTDALQPSSPDLYIAGNSVVGSGNAEINSNGRFVNVSGTSGHPCIVENNWFHRCVRFGHMVGSYVTYRKNRFGLAYHHGFTGSNLDDTYVTDITFQNNLFYCDRGSTGSLSTSPAIQCGYNHRIVVNNLTVVNNTFDGWLYGALDYGDIVDANGNVTGTNIVCVNNIIANGKYAFGRYSSATMVNNLHVLESDFNVVYNQATGYAGGTGGLTGTLPTGFYSGVNKYNRLTGASRNINGVALFDPSYATAQTGRSLAYTVNTLGTDHTLAWGGGTAAQLIIDSGTSAGGGLRTIGCTGKTWTLQQSSLIQQWLWVVSGTGAGQARAITRVTTSTAVAATVSAGGTGYSLGQIIQNQSQTTFDLGSGTGYYPTFKVTGVSAGVITSVSIISGGTITTTGANPVTTTRITGTSGGGCTLTLTYAPGLLLVPDLATGVDGTSVFAVVSAYVQLTDSGTGTVHAGLYLPDPANWQNAVQIPTVTAVDSGITVAVANSPTGSPGYAAAANSPTATDYQWTSGSAKDTGTSDNAPATDYFGTTRPQGGAYDIGFFELVAASAGALLRRIITGGD